MSIGEWSVPGYCDIRELGRGAAGIVMLATHDDTGQPVAVKYLAAELLADPGFRDDFRAEARLLADLAAPTVVRLHEYVESADGAAIVMELLEGVSLRRVLDDRGAIEPEAALWVLRGSLQGLAAAHAASVVHRDYKPENVLVNGGGESKLVDFGIATRAGDGGVLSGTPAYMSPEQWASAPASPHTDVYAATATFVECLTGLLPYDAADLTMLRRQHERAPIPIDGVPDPVRDLVRAGLAKDPADRPVDAAAFLADLEACRRCRRTRTACPSSAGTHRG